MRRIEKLFATKPKRVLNLYCTAGFPEFDSTVRVMKALQDNGADLIELGIPYSDPLADGPVIQQSGAIALANGMSIEALFRQLQGFREVIHVPVVLMGYLNPVLQYGFERFCQHAAALAIDGLILPDLPEYEFETEYGPILQRYGIDFSFLVTPQTEAERVLQLDKLSSGFLYAVSASTTTGSEQASANVADYLQRLAGYHLKNPVLVGFGIHDKASFEAVAAHANGAIIGSAYIKALQQNPGDIESITKEFLDGILK